MLRIAGRQLAGARLSHVVSEFRPADPQHNPKPKQQEQIQNQKPRPASHRRSRVLALDWNIEQITITTVRVATGTPFSSITVPDTHQQSTALSPIRRL